MKMYGEMEAQLRTSDALPWGNSLWYALDKRPGGHSTLWRREKSPAPTRNQTLDSLAVP
jgi:hypothetical protein